ncbi:ATP-dependent RNA helicase TDRD9 [Aplysia californica]|uniref:RNA helicase n=1 Tax=Aplysia californica TaxID=6500 RepID=A0ABM0ZVA9_APLCA|nr:ATP-dependent RNA helicase TDRD9 [Aplysia californica]
MSIITGELELNDIDDWFRIGQDASKQTKKPEAVATSTLQGHLFDSESGGTHTPDVRKKTDAKLPSYRRSTHHPTRCQYVEQYRRQEEEDLLSQAQVSGTSLSGLSPGAVSELLENLELDTTTGGGSVAVPEDLIPEGALSVYQNYRFDHKYSPLPVVEAREKIISTIESNQVTVIQGPTGSGKTTQVPQFIMDHYAEESRYCNIVVTQPRKIAASSIARRVCEERGWSLGTICGYQIGLERQASEDTRILYCTTGVLKEKFIGKKNMHEFTHVILDEVHERDIETDFALLIVKKLLRSNSRHVKVILMSATFDTSAFAQYFALPVKNQLEPAPVVTVGTVLHHVPEFFADDLVSKLGEVPHVEEAQPGISPGMYEMAAGLVQEFDLLEIKEQGRDEKTAFAPIRGSVLIFLPGLHEITEMQKLLSSIDGSFLTIIPLHSSITLSEQSKVFRKAAKGYRKVILSTNIAESSITVTDIKYVVDFCLTKNLFCDPETNFTQLQMEWASKANTKQRKGRAGRVSNGRVYFMVPRWFYETVLPEYGVPEMQRSPLEGLILKTKLFDMGEPKALLALALSPPKLEDIERTILSLKEVGALSSSVGEQANPYDGDLTFIGRVLATLPVSIYVGKLLVLGHVFGVLEECLIIGAALSLKSIFAQPFDKRLAAYKGKVGWSSNSLSDCITVLYAFTTWQNRLKLKEFERAGANEREWCTSHHIQAKSLREVAKLVDELEQRLLKFNIVKPQKRPSFKNDSRDPIEQLILKMVMCGAFYPNYAVKEESNEMEAVKALSNHDPLKTVYVKGLPMNEGILYHKQMKDYFSVCCNDPPPKISTEESRAYIEFSWKQGSMNERRVHPGVYYAIKIRQIGIKVSFDMLDREETKRKLTEVQKVSQGPTGGLRSNRLKAGEGSSGDNFLNIDPQTSTLWINVTEVVECGHFWAQINEPACDNLLMDIKCALNGPGAYMQPITQGVVPGTLVAAPFSDIDGEWYYRACVEKVVADKVPVAGGGALKAILNIRVFYVDYGNRDTVHIDRLFILPQRLHKLPYLAREFYLKGVRPSSVTCSDGVWSEKANRYFFQNVINKQLLAQVYSVVDDVVRVELVETLPNGTEISYNNEIVREKFAEVAEESFLSQQNHQWQEAMKHGSQAGVTQDSRRQVTLTSQSGDAGRAGAQRRGRRIILTGPSNPLEMSFSSITFSGRQRVVRIDPESVNSVAIDDQPENKFSRLMVSGSIALNPAGNSMIARDTTIMPQIPGLPALVTLMFAPYVEYRTDPKCERYIGALCGLGYDEENQSILPDHDIDLVFETTFDNEDIVLINHVRMAVNASVGSNDTMAGWSVDTFISIQKRARETLLQLLKKQREAVEPQAFRNMYEWNQVDPESILYPSVPDADESHTLLRLHNAVCLEEPEPTPDSMRRQQDMLWHLEDLERKVKNGERQPVTCELCSVHLATSQVLAIHMATESHLRRALKVHDGSFK